MTIVMRRHPPQPHSQAGRMRAILSKLGPLTAPELADAIGMDPRRVIGQLADMRRRGMVSKDDSVKPARWLIARDS